jgi:hypothetical protein
MGTENQIAANPSKMTPNPHVNFRRPFPNGIPYYTQTLTRAQRGVLPTRGVNPKLEARLPKEARNPKMERVP